MVAIILKTTLMTKELQVSQNLKMRIEIILDEIDGPLKYR